MLANREWNEEQGLFEEVVRALEDSRLDFFSSPEQDAYRNDGIIEITFGGRKFLLSLQEEVR